jgi:hypothetical protein
MKEATISEPGYHESHLSSGGDVRKSDLESFHRPTGELPMLLGVRVLAPARVVLGIHELDDGPDGEDASVKGCPDEEALDFGLKIWIGEEREVG